MEFEEERVTSLVCMYGQIVRQVILIPDLFWNLCGGGEVLIVYDEGS